jgi:Rod binding domain-containing protein
MTLTAISSSTAAHQNVDAASVTSPTPEQQKAAREFEAIFLRQLMSSLEKGGGMGGQSSGGQVFRSMMVSALADTASEGGGIGLSELILKAMLPPSPQGKPDLPLHAAAPHAAASTTGRQGPAPELAEAVASGAEQGLAQQFPGCLRIGGASARHRPHRRIGRGHAAASPSGSKSTLSRTPQSGQTQSSGTSLQAVPAGKPSRGWPVSSS